jgi:Tfp pilus assembly protein PilF
VTGKIAGTRWVMNRLRKEICLLLLVLVAPATTASQSGRNTVSVTGSVLTEGKNERIEHVVVRLCDTGGNLIAQTTTLDSGEFDFRGIQRGRYILTFQANGFQNTEIHLDLSFVSDRGMTVYMKPEVSKSVPTPSGFSISAHELSMPQAARDVVASGKRKLYADKNAQDALQDFRRAVASAPGYYEAYCEMAMAYLTLGQADEAEKSFRKSIELSRDAYGDAEVGLGMMLIEKGKLEDGERSVRQGVELNPNSWLGFYELSKLDLNRDRLELAQKSAERARLLAPNTPMIYRLLANIHKRQRNYAAMLGDIDAYVKLDPDSPAGLRAKQMRGEVEEEMAKQAQAVDAKPR